ncbi:hypothetical protein ACF3NR_06330 [Vaginella massiliensis]
MQIFDIMLNRRDAIKISDVKEFEIQVSEGSKILLIEVPL